MTSVETTFPCWWPTPNTGANLILTTDPILRLSRPTQLTRLRALAKRGLDEYAIEPTAMKLLRYEDNAVYMVETGAERYMIRLSIREGRTVEEQTSELAWLHAMRDADLLVPNPVRTRSGSYIASVESDDFEAPTTIAAFEWIDGSLSAPRRRSDLGRLLGRATASMHLQAENWARPTEFVRPSFTAKDLFETGPVLTEPQALERLGEEGVDIVRRVAERVHSRIAGLEQIDRLIHSDLHRENLLFTPAREIAFIDFDDCGFGDYMLDIATVGASLGRFLHRDDTAYQAFGVAFLDGYKSIKPLPASIEAFDEFLVLRDMVILNFITHSQNPTVAEWAPASAKGIVQKLSGYLQGTPYPGSIEAARAQ